MFALHIDTDQDRDRIIIFRGGSRIALLNDGRIFVGGNGAELFGSRRDDLQTLDAGLYDQLISSLSADFEVYENTGIAGVTELEQTNIDTKKKLSGFLDV